MTDDRKLVTFTRDMKPYNAGADMLLPAAEADRLVAEGSAKNPRDRFGNPLTPKAEPRRYNHKRG